MTSHNPPDDVIPIFGGPAADAIEELADEERAALRHPVDNRLDAALHDLKSTLGLTDRESGGPGSPPAQ